MDRILNKKGSSCGEIGIVAYHAYAIMGLEKCGDFRLVHIRNPHSSINYNGPFSYKEGGHFWLTDYYFEKYYEAISVVYPKEDVYIYK